MPNTLAHLGIQGLVTRGVWRSADLKWIYLGCVVPDLPWILQRVLRAALPYTDRYDLLLYAGVQASLAFCLVFAAAVAVITDRPKPTFFLIGLSSLFHLLLDASQMKWGNGVHLFAPLNWNFFTFGTYWPESPVSLALTLLGFVYVIVYWRNAVSTPVCLRLCPPTRLVYSMLLLIVYFAVPPFLANGPREADNYYVNTLMNADAHEGKEIAFDRAVLLKKGDELYARNFADEEFKLTGVETDQTSGLMTLKGHFTARRTIAVSAFHIHPKGPRDYASVIGLFLVGMIWVFALPQVQRCR
ncbi:MAG: hypothetical protein KJ626_07260 [Verrucomicrobia bacterium]|nr:hypothetical protein [Verrucomicrobiota bacterium]